MKLLLKTLFCWCSFLPFILDVMICPFSVPSSKSHEIIIYDFVDEEYVEKETATFSRYGQFDYSSYDHITKDGYTLIGWVETDQKGLKNIKELEEYASLEFKENKYILYPYFVDTLKRSLNPGIDNLYYYPIFIKNDNLDNFYLNSPLLDVKVTISYIVVNNHNLIDIPANETICCRKDITYYDLINNLGTVKEIPNCTFLGYSLHGGSLISDAELENKITSRELTIYLMYNHE